MAERKATSKGVPMTTSEKVKAGVRVQSSRGRMGLIMWSGAGVSREQALVRWDDGNLTLHDSDLLEPGAATPPAPEAEPTYTHEEAEAGEKVFEVGDRVRDSGSGEHGIVRTNAFHTPNGQVVAVEWDKAPASLRSIGLLQHLPPSPSPTALAAAEKIAHYWRCHEKSISAADIAAIIHAEYQAMERVVEAARKLMRAPREVDLMPRLNQEEVEALQELNQAIHDALSATKEVRGG